MPFPELIISLFIGGFAMEAKLAARFFAAS
jgi:hypothetical protein